MSIKHLFLTLCGVLCLPLAASAASDTTAPTVTGVAPVTATKNVAVTISGTYHDDSAGVASCTLFVDGISQGVGIMNLSVPTGRDGVASQSYTYTGSNSSFSVVISCTDQAVPVNTGQSSPTTVSVSTPGTVGAVSPTAATVNEATSFSATYSGFTSPQTAAGCWLVVDGVTKYPGATLSGGVGSTNGTASKTYTFTTVGAHTAFMSCLQNEGTYIYGPTTSITVSATPPADTTAPTVGQIASIAPMQNVAITISAAYSDSVGVTSCTLYVDGTNWGTMNGVSGGTSGTATKDFAFNPSGSHTAYVTCQDAAGNLGTGSPRTVSVSAPPADAISPTVSIVAQTAASTGVPITFTATYSDNVTVNGCQLMVNGGVIGDSSLPVSNFGTTSKSYTFTSGGTYQVQFRCHDSVGNWGAGTARSVAVSGTAASGDISFPVVGNLWENSATVGTPLTLHANAYDNLGIVQCDLYVDGAWRTSMTLSGGTNPSVSYTFTTTGSHSAYVQCRDMAGNITNGPSQAITVSTTFPIPPTSGTGRLVKAACPAYVGADHPCKAVYYFGGDGKRHAFPNERVYFTWYTDFNTVDEVSDAYLASLPLGLNVTYRPGTRLVKFTTVNRVYAVSRRGVLRWMTSEALANALYGPSWNRMVDDIPDAFYTNYTFGADITSSASYSPAAEISGTATIEANL